jgi:SSS family solute:Na+ symporter
MAGIVGRWLVTYKPAMISLLALSAMAYLYNPHFASQAAEVQKSVAQIPNHQTREQVLFPVALSHLLPTGVRGALCVIFLMGIFGGDGAALHSWGSLFIQDVLVPLRKKPFGPVHHIFYLRLSIIGVALFAFVFGSLFQQTDYLLMWWAITGAIFLGGAGAAIIGGLYWSWGTTAGAWAAMITGSVLGVGGIIAQQIDSTFPLNGLQISFAVAVVSSMLYVLISLSTCREAFNMDRMLHRGAYAKIAERVGDETPKTASKKQSLWMQLIGVDRNFTVSDRWLAISVFAWAILWFLIFAIGTIWNIIAPWPEAVWLEFLRISGVYIPVFITILVACWFTGGGLRDMRDFFRHLRAETVNYNDDGTVVDHQNLDEATVNTHPPKTNTHTSVSSYSA